MNHRQDNNIEYGGAALFVSYLYERFSLDLLRQLAFHPQQGLDALDALLAAHGAGISADDVFTDWVIANFLLDNRRENGRFGYPQLWTPEMEPARRLPLHLRTPLYLQPRHLALLRRLLRTLARRP